MVRPTYFLIIFVISMVVAFGIISFLKRNAMPLRKAWIVYTAMYALHGILFLGIMLMLPVALPWTPVEEYAVDRIETINDVKNTLKEQREDIEQLRKQIHQTSETIYISALILALLAPMLYYNLFKYNLEVEKLSGKRMGSFD